MNGVDQIGVVQPGWRGNGASSSSSLLLSIERPSLLQSTIDVPCDPSPFARALKIRVKACRPEVWGFAFVFQNQADLQGQFQKMIMTVKVYSKDRIPYRIAFGQFDLEPRFVYGANDKLGIAGKTVHGHLPNDSVGAPPMVLFPFVQASPGKWKQDGNASVNFLEQGVCVVFRPMNHVANGTVAHVDVPVKQPGSFFR